MVTGELALAVMLLVFAGLLLESFRKLREADTGFARTPALAFRTFYRRAIEELSRIPRVTAVAANHSLPLALNQNYAKPTIKVDGQSVDEQQSNPFVNVQIVSPGYLEAMGIALREGCALQESDRLDTPPVAVVSRPLARRLFGDAGAVGRRVQLPGLLPARKQTGMAPDRGYSRGTAQRRPHGRTESRHLPFQPTPIRGRYVFVPRTE